MVDYVIIAIYVVLVITCLYYIYGGTSEKNVFIDAIQHTHDYRRNDQARLLIQHVDNIAWGGRGEIDVRRLNVARELFMQLRNVDHAWPRQFVQERIAGIDAMLGVMPIAGGITNPALIKTAERGTLDAIALPAVIDQSIKSLTPINNDTQNVHDSSIVASIRTIVEKLKPDMSSMGEDDMRAALLDGGVTPIALWAYEEILKSPEPILAYGASVFQALQMVWSRVPISIIIDALASCVEDGHMVCMMGRFNRIIETVTGLPDIPLLKTRAFIRREILETAARIRSEYDTVVPPPAESFETVLRARLGAIYVGAMTQQALDSELAEWINDV